MPSLTGFKDRPSERTAEGKTYFAGRGEPLAPAIFDGKSERDDKRRDHRERRKGQAKEPILIETALRDDRIE